MSTVEERREEKDGSREIADVGAIQRRHDERASVAQMLRRSVQATKQGTPSSTTHTSKRLGDCTPGTDKPDIPKMKSSFVGANEKELMHSPDPPSPSSTVGLDKKRDRKYPYGNIEKAAILFDSDTGQREPEVMSDAGQSEPQVVSGTHAPMSTPIPPVNNSSPGAYRVSGIDGLTDEREFSSNELSLPGDLNQDDPVAAHLVDKDEDEQRIRELEEQNRRLREREQTAAVATVLSKREILRSFFNLRDPEFRRQRICGLVVIVLVMVGIVLGIALTRKGPVSTTPAATQAPTPAPTSALHGSVSEFLSDVSFDGGASLNDQSTPQFKAVQWLTNNTNLDNYTDGQRIQRYALATLFFSTQGTKWLVKDLWLDDGPECKWAKLACTSQDEVSRLQFLQNDLNGTIPPEIALLSDSLDSIQFQENTLVGKLPPEFQFLSHLTTLDLDENVLSGTIHTEYGRLSDLIFLRMGKNKLTGTIPTELFQLRRLNTFRLGNNLSGTFPSLIAQLTGLSK